MVNNFKNYKDAWEGTFFVCPWSYVYNLFQWVFLKSTFKPNYLTVLVLITLCFARGEPNFSQT